VRRYIPILYNSRAECSTEVDCIHMPEKVVDPVKISESCASPI
jgi:hypothetical protein